MNACGPWASARGTAWPKYSPPAAEAPTDSAGAPGPGQGAAGPIHGAVGGGRSDRSPGLGPSAPGAARRDAVDGRGPGGPGPLGAANGLGATLPRKPLRPAESFPPGPKVLSAAEALARHRAGASLRGIDAAGQDFSGCDLQGADFSEALLDGACFAGAHLQKAIFTASPAAGCGFARRRPEGRAAPRRHGAGGRFQPGAVGRSRPVGRRLERRQPERGRSAGGEPIWGHPASGRL
jgi:hypothetical protein